MNKTTERPVNLDLLQMRMPVTAIVSILHRISGILLIILIPYGIYLFGLSLESEQGFVQVQAQLCSWPGKLFIVVMSWIVSHHLCAGLRFLLIDIDIGVQKKSATTGAWLVHIAALLMTMFISWVLL